MSLFDLKQFVPTFPDFPQKGINFYDVTGLLRDSEVFALTVSQMTRLIDKFEPNRLFALDSRGFLFAAPVAANLGIGLSLLRKKGKLPGAVEGYDYDLEYGTATIECRREDFDAGERLVVVDDLLATGGTLRAGVELLKKLSGNVVGAAAVIELGDLNGRTKIDVPVETLLYYPH